jgi:hypothetical protein
VEHLMNLVSILCCTVIVAVVRNFQFVSVVLGH